MRSFDNSVLVHSNVPVVTICLSLKLHFSQSLAQILAVLIKGTGLVTTSVMANQLHSPVLEIT